MTIVVCAFVVLAALLIASDPVSSQQQLDVYNPGWNLLSQAISPLKSMFDSIVLPIVPQIHQSNSQSKTHHQSKQTTKFPRRKVKNKQRVLFTSPIHALIRIPTLLKITLRDELSGYNHAVLLNQHETCNKLCLSNVLFRCIIFL